MAQRGAAHGEGVGVIHLAGVECSGNERGLANCLAAMSVPSHCSHAQDASVSCDIGKQRVCQINILVSYY